MQRGGGVVCPWQEVEDSAGKFCGAQAYEVGTAVGHEAVECALDGFGVEDGGFEGVGGVIFVEDIAGGALFDAPDAGGCDFFVSRVLGDEFVEQGKGFGVALFVEQVDGVAESLFGAFGGVVVFEQPGLIVRRGQWHGFGIGGPDLGFLAALGAYAHFAVGGARHLHPLAAYAGDD